jgi:putative flippase GtrA
MIYAIIYVAGCIASYFVTREVTWKGFVYTRRDRALNLIMSIAGSWAWLFASVITYIILCVNWNKPAK